MTASLQAGLVRTKLAHEVPADEWERWEFLRDSPLKDANTKELQRAAGVIGQGTFLWIPGPPNRRARAFAEVALALCQRELKYRSDTDEFAKEEDIRGFTRTDDGPLAAVARGADDCDEKARLFVALCLAVGLSARMVPWWHPVNLTLDHVSAEVLLEEEGGGASWVHAECILRRAQLGEMADDVPREANGKWLK